MLVSHKITDALLLEKEQQTLEYESDIMDAWRDMTDKQSRLISSDDSGRINLTTHIEEYTNRIGYVTEDFESLQKRKTLPTDDGVRDKKRRVSLDDKLNRSSKSSVCLDSNSLGLPSTNSLLFQLRYVSSEEDSNASTTTDFTEHLTCDPRADDLKKNKENCANIEAEVNGSSYGWFVELDKDCNTDPGRPKDLAFSAITAPEKTTLEEEAEWALAADTVDDVLGDLF
jgi:hypothetical protein